MLLTGVSASRQFAGMGGGRLVRPGAAGFRLSPLRGAFRFPVATADIAHGIHGCAAEEPQRANRRAHAWQEFLRRHMAHDDRCVDGRGLPRDCSGSDRLLQIDQAGALPVFLPAARVEHACAARLARGQNCGAPRALNRGHDKERVAWNSALLYDMIFTQPVFYEFEHITVPTLLIIGDKDNTAIGKDFAPPVVQATLGHYPELAKSAAMRIKGAKLVEFSELGHAPQIQDPAAFHKVLLGWLAAP